jgi:hypothetical protein
MNSGETIYGANADIALGNTASYGNAVYVNSFPAKIRNFTVGPDADLDSAQSGVAGGWVDSSTDTGITCDDAWTLENDGRRKSPAIGDNGITKARVSFTVADNTPITIQLDVSSESDFDFAFISTLDNGFATYDSGYYTRISGTESIMVTIPVPTAGSHFRKPRSQGLPFHHPASRCRVTKRYADRGRPAKAVFQI